MVSVSAETRSEITNYSLFSFLTLRPVSRHTLTSQGQPICDRRSQGGSGTSMNITVEKWRGSRRAETSRASGDLVRGGVLQAKAVDPTWGSGRC